MKPENLIIYVCIAFSILFIYGKYVVDDTAIEKLSSTIMILFWILLATLFYIMDKLKNIEKVLKDGQNRN